VSGQQRKRIAFSFDDVPLADGGLLANAQQRTAMLVEGLAQAEVPQAVFFVVAGQIGHPLIPHGERRIAAYTGAGHVIANHGFDHLALADTPLDEYLADVDRATAWLSGRPGYRPWFRYPYLDEGDTDPAKRAALRRGLVERGLSNGYVTVRSTDYHLDGLAGQAPGVDRAALRDLYVELLLGSADFYDRMAVRAIGRSPAHVMLLHANDLNALFIADVAAAFRRAGWDIVGADEAYQDPIAEGQGDEWNVSGRVVAMSFATGVATELAYPPIEPGPLAGAFASRVSARPVPPPATERRTREMSVSKLDTLFHDLVVLARPAIFVEGGAFEADTSLRVAAALPGCRVIAFEANPYVYDRFSASRDFAAASVEYVHQALASEPGKVVFRVVSASSSLADDRVQGYNSMLPRIGDDWLGDVEYEEVEVPATTLDAEFGDADGPAAMWLDVEGATGIVLAGARRFLDRCDVVKIEVEEVPLWSEQWLAGAVVEAVAKHELTPVARDVQEEDQYNVLFVSERLLDRPDVQERLAEHRAKH
jgi:peptidoglycan-N-acetylglucosamine deacetylase